MNQDILNKLANDCKVHPETPDVSAKTKTKFICHLCNSSFTNTASSILIRHKTYGSVGCPECVASARLSKIREQNRAKLEKTFILPDNFDNIKYKDNITLINKTCNHQFTTKLDNVMAGGVICPICEDERRRTINQWATPPKKENMSFDIFAQKLQESNLKYKRNVFVKDVSEYAGMLVPIAFTCDMAHEWQARPANVIHLGSGCPYCAKANYSKIAIEWLNTISADIKHAENGGEVRLRGQSGKLYSVDGYDPATNTVYEFNGSAYHGDPSLYDNTDTPHPFKKHLTAKELRDLTTNKSSDLMRAGYVVVSQWESEYRKSSKILSDFITDIEQIANTHEYTRTGIGFNVNSIKVYYHDVNLCREQLVGKSYLLDLNKQSDKCLHVFSDEYDSNRKLIIDKIRYITKTNKNINKIAARLCDITILQNDIAAQFIKNNHAQGSDNSQIYYGLTHRGVLVAVMGFTKPRLFMSKSSVTEDVWELSRFATLNEFSVVGAASKLLKSFENNHQPKEIFSFADKRWSDGNLYKSLGFIENIKSYQAYYYVINGIRHHRFGYRKSIQPKRLEYFDQNLNEYDNMLLNGYDRVWDCGSIKFTKTYSK